MREKEIKYIATPQDVSEMNLVLDKRVDQLMNRIFEIQDRRLVQADINEILGIRRIQAKVTKELLPPKDKK